MHNHFHFMILRQFNMILTFFLKDYLKKVNLFIKKINDTLRKKIKN